MSFLVYSMPYLIYLCSSIFSTILVINASISGASPFFISLIAVSYGLGMMITAGTFSRLKIPKNTYNKLLYVEACLQGAIALVCLFYLPINLIHLYAFIYGCATTVFFVCFQTVLDSVSKEFPVRISSGLFILSWSLGLSTGPIITGFIYNLGQVIGFIIVILMSGVIFLFYYLSRHLHIKRKPDSTEPFMRAPRYKVYIGWLIVFVGAMVLHTLRFMFLDYGLRIGFSKSTVGILVGVLCAFAGFGALFSSFYFRLLERKRVFTVVGLMTPAALILMTFTRNFWLFVTSFIILGFVSGFGYFFGLYYALADQEHSASNVAINETLSGFGSLFVPFIVGYLASEFGYFYGFLFIMVISLICYSIAIYIMYQKKREALLKEKFLYIIEEVDSKYENR